MKPGIPERRNPDHDRRQGALDRRGAWRGGRRASDVLLAALLTAGTASPLAAQAAEPQAVGQVRTGRRTGDRLAVVRAPEDARLPNVVAEVPPMRFGVDAASLSRATSAGLLASYGSVWAGSWIQKYGWDGVREQVRAARKAGVTPVVHWWYWGDDISPAAVANGVRDRYQGVHKDRATWNRLSGELADLLAAEAGGNAVVVLETEFNKQGIEDDEAFDGYLAEQIATFHRRRGLQVVLGFGNWAPEKWGRFDRAVAAADMLGIQLLRSSVRDASTYGGSVDTLVSAARELERQFHKPTVVTDLALSSYGPDYEKVQDRVLDQMFRRLPELKAAGVRAVLWRSVVDDPSFDPANYHGMAERHWGLLRADGSPKPAFARFVQAARDESARGRVVLLGTGKQPARGVSGGKEPARGNR